MTGSTLWIRMILLRKSPFLPSFAGEMKRIQVFMPYSMDSIQGSDYIAIFISLISLSSERNLEV